MSAICGMMGPCAASAEARTDLAAMLAALAHRGPDGTAAHLDPGRGLALGVRALDARTGGVVVTPGTEARGAGILRCEGADGPFVLAADAQIFNLEEVAAWLAGRGHVLRGDPDEVFVRLYQEEGVAGLRRLDAQFAVALWDPAARRLVLARDPLGVRPLYFHDAGDRGVIFASEIKALLQHPLVPAAVDEVGASHYLTFLSVPGPRTLFSGVQKLPAGSARIFRAAGGGVSVPRGGEAVRYWDLLDEPIPERTDEGFYVERTRELHRQAVLSRRAPGPIAALLSGGNDSSANVALLAKQGAADLHTFTVGLADLEGQNRYNDLHYARKVAEFAGTRHHESLLSVDEFLGLIPETIEAMDDLVSEPSAVFLYHALRLARAQGLRVVITGEANDELTCGHGEMIRIRQRYYKRWRPYLKLPPIVRWGAAVAAQLTGSRRSDILSRAAEEGEYFWSFETAWMEHEKPAILTPEAWARVKHDGPGRFVAGLAERVRRSPHGQRDYLNQIVYFMMQDHYFGNLMLGKLDLLASRLGLEPRCPYTAAAYAHFVYNVPATFKFRGDLVKYFFKRAIEGLLPDEIIYRPKQGFRTPVVELFQGRLGDWARPVLLDSGLTEAGVLRRDHLEGLLADHRAGRFDYSNRLWTAMVLNLWHRRWAHKPVRERVEPLPHAVVEQAARDGGGRARPME